MSPDAVSSSRSSSRAFKPAPAILITAVVSVLLLALTFRPVVEGDGVGYFSYLHALMVSHSLDFNNEYSAAINSRIPLFLPLVTTRTATGQLGDFFGIGSALLSMPAYLAALAWRPSGEPQFGPPFVHAFAMSSLFYLLLGLAFSYRLAVSVVGDRRASAVGAVAALFTTPLVYYGLSDPSYSHAFSVFCSSAFVYAWWTGPPRSARGWLGLGLLGGVMAMTRFQDGLLMAIVLVDAKRLRWPALLMIPGALLGFAPQLAVDHFQFGSWLPARPPGQTLDPLHGQYLQALFSSNDGLLIWTPAAIFAGAGLYFVRNQRIVLACLIAFLLQLAIIGAAPDSAGRAFGARRFLDLIPFAVVGLAAFWVRFRLLSASAVVALTVWNLTLEANFEYIMKSGSTVGYRELLLGQLSAVSFLPRLFAKGAVVRDLLLWPQAHTRFDPVGGTALLAAEIVCVIVALAVSQWRLTARSLIDQSP